MVVHEFILMFRWTLFIINHSGSFDLFEFSEKSKKNRKIQIILLRDFIA